MNLNSGGSESAAENYIVLPVMERVPKGRETREERGSFRSERTGPPVGGRPLSTVPVTPAPCGADPVSRPCSSSVRLGLGRKHKECSVTAH